MSRLSDAIEMRDTVLALLRHYGARHTLSGVPLTAGHVGGLHLLLMRAKDLKGSAMYQATAMPDEPEPEDMVDVRQGQKVFTAYWDGDKRFHLSRFNRGDWEGKLKSALENISSASPTLHPKLNANFESFTARLRSDFDPTVMSKFEPK